MPYVCVWEAEPFKSRRVNLPVGSKHPYSGKILTEDDSINTVINALKEKALTAPDKMSKQEKSDFCWYVESMNPEQLGDRECFAESHDGRRITRTPTNVDEKGNHKPTKYSKQNLKAAYEKISGKSLSEDSIHVFAGKRVKKS